jgi:putative ABC transport system ATP-binding protein
VPVNPGRVVLDALVAGLPYAFNFLGVWLIYRLLNDFDLTVDGSFTLGAAVTAALVIYRGVNPAVATICALAAATGAGLVTAGVHLKLKVPLLLAGIITMIALYSVNLRIMDMPNISFLHVPTIFTPFSDVDPVISDLRFLGALVILLAAVSAALGFFLKTDLGLSMRAAGANTHMARSVGINTDVCAVLFLLLANALVGASGSIVAQQQLFADLNMGFGVVLVGITSILLGELALRRTGGVWSGIGAVVVGTSLYYVAVSVAVELGLRPSDLRAFTALLLLLAITASLAVRQGERWLWLRRRLLPGPPARPSSVPGAPAPRQPARRISRSASIAGRAAQARDAAATSGSPSVRGWLSLRNVTVAYNAGLPNEVVALRGLDLDIRQGDFLTVIGSNGAGKSTLVSTIAGSVRPVEGDIWLRDTLITGEPEERRARYVARVFQDPLSGTCPDFSIEENLALARRRGARRGLSLAVTERRRREFAAYLAPFGLGFEDRLGERVGRLSGGERQALALLMAVMEAPDILLLDEHTAALDPRNQSMLQEMTVRLVQASSCTTVMVTHNMEDALHYGNRMIMLHRGAVLFDVEGSDKNQLSVETLVSSFHQAHGAITTDEMLLT